MNKVTELLDAVGGVITCVSNLADSIQAVADVLTDMKSLEVIEAQPVAQIPEKAAKPKRKKPRLTHLKMLEEFLQRRARTDLHQKLRV